MNHWTYTHLDRLHNWIGLNLAENWIVLKIGSARYLRLMVLITICHAYDPIDVRCNENISMTLGACFGALHSKKQAPLHQLHLLAAPLIFSTKTWSWRTCLGDCGAPAPEIWELGRNSLFCLWWLDEGLVYFFRCYNTLHYPCTVHSKKTSLIMFQCNCSTK
jgi:hypothetical protein